jgi:hypothetical protein
MMVRKLITLHLSIIAVTASISDSERNELALSSNPNSSLTINTTIEPRARSQPSIRDKFNDLLKMDPVRLHDMFNTRPTNGSCGTTATGNRKNLIKAVEGMLDLYKWPKYPRVMKGLYGKDWEWWQLWQAVAVNSGGYDIQPHSCHLMQCDKFNSSGIYVCNVSLPQILFSCGFSSSNMY